VCVCVCVCVHVRAFGERGGGQISGQDITRSLILGMLVVGMVIFILAAPESGCNALLMQFCVCGGVALASLLTSMAAMAPAVVVA
jgi:hypothetical protein